MSKNRHSLVISERFRHNARMTDHFKLDAHLFPASTREFIPVADMLKWGVLPLGYKKQSGVFGTQKRINIGMVEPGNPQAVQFVRDLLNKSYKISLKIFQIDADEFLDVVHLVYGVPRKGAGSVREASDLSCFRDPPPDANGLDGSVRTGQKI